jgi:hypothetical protein
MITRTPRDPWRTVWQIAVGDGLLATLLFATAAGLIVAAWLPQMPSADPIAFARWLSETRPRFGQATTTVQALGLFSVTRSFGFRATVALLAGCLLLRAIETGHQLSRTRSTTTMASLLTHTGALLLLVGLLADHLWGWRVEGLVLRGDQQVALAGTGEWVALDGDARSVTHSAGISAFVEEHVLGVQVSASDSEGRALAFHQAHETDLVSQPTVALVEDRFFAIPSAQLVIRLAPQPGDGARGTDRVLVQVYRSPPGQLAAEHIAEADAEVIVDDVTLRLTHVPHARLVAVANPGVWPTFTGILSLVAGLLASAILSARPRSLISPARACVPASGALLPSRGEPQAGQES